MSETRHGWIGHVQPTGLVVAPAVLDRLGLIPLPQYADDSRQVEELLGEAGDLPDAWPLLNQLLGWPAARVAGAPGGPELLPELSVGLADQETLLEPTYAVRDASSEGWQLLVRVEAPDVILDKRGVLEGWEATPHQRFERLLREKGIGAGVLIGARETGRRDESALTPELRLVVAPKGETSGWIAWPLASLASVAGREMLGALKMLLGRESLFTNPPELRLPQVLAASRAAQADVSTKLSGQVLAALHELLRGLDAADGALIRELAARQPQHLYEGLLTVLMRLIFILYAEDRGLTPSITADGGAELYEQGYSVGGLFSALREAQALYPDTMDERRGAWGRLLALFRLIERGHPSGFMQRRGGKLFSGAAFPFLLGKREHGDAERVLTVSDGCILRVLEDLMTIGGERLSYRTLDVEQIGSVYETVMGFTVEEAAGPSLAIKAGKNNKVPVFVDLTALAAAPPGDRAKLLKEWNGRGQFPAAATRAIRDAVDAKGLEAALSAVHDPRGSPGGAAVATGTPILQPTDERRRTGSHYTPRSLTEPIVRHALEPAFERIGDNATPEAVLELKVCDPAVGSGAFLVEACRQIGARLVKAWETHPLHKPPIPADEDDELHARRLVAQRCLYGVDRNPMALDLAKLSLWLATLARDHEFSFLDHALKAGDSLVGLTRGQIEGASWEEDAPPNLWRLRVQQDVDSALQHRQAIRNAPDDVALAMQQARHEQVERGLDHVRLIGDAVIATFFAHDKPRPRRAALADIALAAGGGVWERLRQRAVSLEGGTHPVRPFHWEIEFPEVFGRENPGFDAIVGNPPFAGKNTIIGGNRKHYLDWLQTLHPDAHGNADISAHFYRRAFAKLREGGAFGLIATNTIRQGDTRESGLKRIIEQGGTIFRAVSRHKWEGEAAVVVSLVFVCKGERRARFLDNRPAERISAYLVEGELDGSPARLKENADQSFQGSILLGMGFTFDDVAAAKGRASTIAEMESLIAINSRNAELIKPFLGSDEVSNSPIHSSHRFAIDFFERPHRRIAGGQSWYCLSETERREQLRAGEVASDYPGDVAADWPDLLKIVEIRVKPERVKQSDAGAAQSWWRYLRPRAELYDVISSYENVLVIGAAALAHHAFARVPVGSVFSHKLIVLALPGLSHFAVLQSRTHELWNRAFGSTFGDAPTYNPTQVFETFPFPVDFQTNPDLEAVGQAYHDHRAQLMVARDQGMTPTYNRFHDRFDEDADIVELRRFHHEMDRAVLRAYGWDDLADAAAPEFLTEDSEDDHKYRNRLFWPAPFRDELLARLLKLNEERAAKERRDTLQ